MSGQPYCAAALGNRTKLRKKAPLGEPFLHPARTAPRPLPAKLEHLGPQPIQPGRVCLRRHSPSGEAGAPGPNNAYSRGEYGRPATGPGSSTALFCVRCREGGRRMEKSCRLFDLGDKEVIDLQSGARLGYIYDAEIDLETGQIRSFFTPEGLASSACWAGKRMPASPGRMWRKSATTSSWCAACPLCRRCRHPAGAPIAVGSREK